MYRASFIIFYYNIITTFAFIGYIKNLRWIFRKWDGGMDWINLAQEGDKWRTLVNAVVNLLKKDSAPWSKEVRMCVCVCVCVYIYIYIYISYRIISFAR
jgi:hypothetical protein